MLWPDEGLFPGHLLPGETVAAYAGEGLWEDGDFALASVHGHQYRVTASPWLGWRIARMPFEFSPSNGGYCWLGDSSTLAQVLEWMRWDADSRALADGRWKRWGHLFHEVPFSLELVTEELEPGVLRIAQYGRQGIAADYQWGWEIRKDGRLPENPNRRSSASSRLEYTVWCLARDGFDAVPTQRLRILRSYWSQERDCATGGPNHLGSCKSTHPRYLVDVLDEEGSSLGTVVLCARHVGFRLAGTGGYYGPWELVHAAQKISGRSWTDWEDRLVELAWDLVAPAVDRGGPVPDLIDALLQEALDLGERQAELDAKRAAKGRGLPKREQDRCGRVARAERHGRRSELTAAALRALP